MWLWIGTTFAADETWDVNAPHGAVHEVPFDLTEGTWMSVAVSGETVVFDLLGDLWSVPLSGGSARQLTSGPAWDTQPAFSPDGRSIAFTSDRGGNENVWVMGADGSDARALTEETDARCTEPRFDESGRWVIYRRRTIDTRSIGVTEIWQRHIDGGKGFPLTSLDEHPHAAEPFVQGQYLWFSSRHGRFSYDEDAVAGLWDVMRLDRKTGDLRPFVYGGGSASRPLASSDGRSLYFVSRYRTSTLLERISIGEAGTGKREVIADWLSRDELEAFALHGTYPAMALAEDGDIVLWAGGKLWRVDPQTRARAEIPFRAQGKLTLHDVTRWPTEIPDTVEANVLRWPTLSSRGALAFSALGALWVSVDGRAPERVGPDRTGYAPAFSPDGKQLAWTSFDDTLGGSLLVTGPSNETATWLSGRQLTNPAWSEDGRSLVVLRSAGASVGGDLSDEPWYEIVHVTEEKGQYVPRVVTALSGQGGARKTRLFLRGDRVYFMDFRQDEPRKPDSAYLCSLKLDGTDKRDHLSLGEAEEVVLSPDGTLVAYKLGHQLHLTAMPPYPSPASVEALPHTQVTKIVGDWLGFTPDSSAVTWIEGPVFKKIAVEGLLSAKEEEEEGKDPLAEDPRVVSQPIRLSLPRAAPEGSLLLQHVDVISMAGDEVLRGVDILIENDRISKIGPGLSAPDARAIDLTGKTVIPGLVDVHAHMHYGASDILPEQDWRYEVALDFGVTTIHDPSANTDLVFTQRERVEAGFARGPRVFSTGFILYGALDSAAAPTTSLDEARAHLKRLARYGARSVKVYQQSRRDVRQYYAIACREERMLCVPEGGGDLFMDLGMVMDGYHAIEHALPETPLYADVRTLFAGSTRGLGDGYGTFYTPTLQVAYGGLSGKLWFEQHEDPLSNPRLLRHTPERWLQAGLWRGEVLARDEDWRFRSTAIDAARMQKEGLHVTLGAHGELQGLGAHWELWALASDGAMLPHDALRAGTIEGARYLGLDREIGSIEPGKLADLIVLDADPLLDIRNTAKIHAVIKNGELQP